MCACVRVETEQRYSSAEQSTECVRVRAERVRAVQRNRRAEGESFRAVQSRECVRAVQSRAESMSVCE